MHDCARSATEPSKTSTKIVTKTQKSMILAHLQNLVTTQTFSNEFSGMRRVRQKLHMVCGIAHTQPQPKRIGVTRIMVKTNQNT